MNLAVFQGPKSQRLCGWFHCLVLDVDTGRRLSWLSTNGIELRAERNGWQYFPAGSWENGAPPGGMMFSPIRLDILAKLQPNEAQPALAF